MEGVNVWVDGWVGGLEKESQDRGGRGGRSAKVIVHQMQQKSNQALGLTSIHVIIDSTLKGTVHGPLVFQHHPLHPLQSQRQMLICSGHTHTQTLCPYTLEAWIITRIYWMVVVAPHSIKSFFIGFMMNETAMMGEDAGRRGLQRAISNWNHRMSPSAGPGWAATLSDEPPEAVGVEMNGGTPSFSQHWLEKGEQKQERESKKDLTSTGGWCMTRFKTVKSNQVSAHVRSWSTIRLYAATKQPTSSTV